MPVMPKPDGCTCCRVHRSGTLFLGPAPVDGTTRVADQPVVTDPELAKADKVRDETQAAFERADAKWGELASKLHQVDAEATRLAGAGYRVPHSLQREHEKLSKATDAAWQTRQDRAEEAQQARQTAEATRRRVQQKEIDAW